MPESAPRIAVFGAGGHGKVVVDAIERQGDGTVVLVLDDNPATFGSTLLGHRIAGGRDLLLAERARFDSAIVAIGSNRIRLAVAAWLVEQGIPLHTAIHPAACVAPSARIGPGTLVMPGAVVNADAVIGANVIVNSGAIVEHDCQIGDGAHIAPGAVLCGGVVIGSRTLVGAGAVLVPGINIGPDLLVKAGSLAKNSLGNMP